MTRDLLYTVDPGKHKSAVASFLNGELIGVWFAKPETMEMAAKNLGRVAMERPRSYPGSPVRENDLLDLMAAGMEVAAQLKRPLETVQLVTPAEWKGQVPKPITKKRIEGKLSQAERMRLGSCLLLAPVGERHNLFDAVGIGLFILKRAGRGMV